MIYICADDYGITPLSSERIMDCAKNGSINKISVFPNFDLHLPLPEENINWSLHLNLVEGRCMSPAGQVPLIAHNDGSFRHRFFGLFVLSLFKKKEFQEQVYRELRAQLAFWRDNVSGDLPIMTDSHQHTHMIPSVFRMLLKAIEDENIAVKYIRIPSEPILPYVMTPSLYFTYSPVNIIKQWLLKFFGKINKKKLKEAKIPTAYFMGILFSGRMDAVRVKKVLPRYIKKATKAGKDIEVLFHPGYMETGESLRDITFREFYLSPDRETEYQAVNNIAKEVYK